MVTGTAPTTARRLGPISSTKLFVILSVSASVHPLSSPARCGCRACYCRCEVDRKMVTIVTISCTDRRRQGPGFQEAQLGFDAPAAMPTYTPRRQPGDA